MKKKFFILITFMGLISMVIFVNADVCLKNESSLLLINIDVLANGELGPDGMELVTYRCNDDIHNELTCEISSGTTTIDCTYADETYCPPTGGDSGEEDGKDPSLTQCPAGGNHSWIWFTEGGIFQMKCSKCGMIK